MAALYDNSAEAFSQVTTSAKSTASFAVGGSNRVLYCFVVTTAGSPLAPSTVKWNGTESFTQIGTTVTTTNGRHTKWRLIAPTATTSTVDVAWAGNQDEQAIIAISFKDADQTTPNGTVTEASGTGTSATVNATSVSGDLVVDSVMWDDAGGNLTITPSGSQTSRQEVEGADCSFNGHGVSTLSATGASTTMAWTISGSPTNGWRMATFAVNGAALGPTINTQPTNQTANVGSTATFTISATTSGGALSYQWKVNGSNVGTDSTSYTTGTLANSNQWDQITCVVTDTNGSTTSSAATLFIAFAAAGTGPQRRNTVGAFPVGTLRWLGVVSASGGVTGTVAYTNANDTSAASGKTTITGTVAKTNANDTSAATGTTTITGTLARTNANDTSAASGSPVSSGTLATTNANDTLAASGTVGGTVTGTLATTNSNDTLAASGSTTVTGTVAKTNANDTSAATGATTVTGSLTYTNNNDTLAASGSIGGAVDGSLAYTNNNDTLVASGVVPEASTSVPGAPGRFMRRFSAEINGKFYYFDSLAELQHVLNSFKTKQKKKIAKKVTKTVIPVTIPHVIVQNHVPMWAQKEIEKANASLEAYYWQQYEQLMNQDDEEAAIALFG